MGRLIGVITLCALLVGCQTTATPVATPIPTPHAAVTAAVLQPGDAPATMNACPGSGSLADYITSLQGTNPSLATTTAAEWQQLRAEGAVGAAISLFAADLATCSAELAATSKGKSVASLVAVFGDEGQADRAWESGILGFVPPAPGEQAPGLNRGTTTGLGLSAWTYDRSPVRFACWRHSVFVALVVLTNLDLATFKSMTAAVDARLN